MDIWLKLSLSDIWLVGGGRQEALLRKFCAAEIGVGVKSTS